MPEAALHKHMARCPDRGDSVATATNDGRKIEASATNAAAPVSETLRAIMMAYRAWLGANKGRLRELGWTTAELVRHANDMVTRVLLCPDVPALDEKTIMSMGLRKTPGIVAAPPGVKLQQ